MNAGRTEKTLEETLTLLPHAYPFRFLDRLIEINKTSAIGIKAISAGDFFHEVDGTTGSALPALLIAEALAQLSGLVMANGRSDCPGGAYLVGINELHLKRGARVGETLRLHAETIIAFETMARFSAKATIGAKEVLKCELTMALSQDI